LPYKNSIALPHPKIVAGYAPVKELVKRLIKARGLKV